MAEPFVGEICCFGFNFAPRDWAQCNGQLMAISQNQALFAIIGTIYGGDGITTFALPNLQGRIPMHWGNSAGFNTTIGEVLGTNTVTLTTLQLPQHIHGVIAVSAPGGTAGERTAEAGATAFLSASKAPNLVWQTSAQNVTAAFSPKAIGTNGGSQSHDNMQPYLTMNFCMALFGVFPSRN